MKNFLAACVQRKVTVAMLTATVFIFGIISWFKLDREYMPELQFPQLVILTSYANASSSEVENLVTKVIEEAAGTVRNVQRIHSSSKEGISIVTVEFLWGTSMDLASLNLREKVDLAKAKLPRDSGEPRIEKFNPFALPVITFSLSGAKTDYELLALARRPVGEILEKTPGVAAVSITGGREREILIELDQAKLSARSLPISDVAQAVAKSNITYPAGTVKDATFDYVVRVVGGFDTPADLGRISVALDRTRMSSALSPSEARMKKQRGPSHGDWAQPVPLASVGQVTDGFAEASSYSRYDGKPTITLSILKQAEGNVVRVAGAVRERLPDIQSKLPKDVQLSVVYDQSTFITHGIRDMVRDSLLGAILAYLVLLLFLGNHRDAMVVGFTIPVSILATFFMMDAKGMTINTITLAGLAIGIGMLVDGAIVVEENIARHKAMGKPTLAACVDGSHEVFGAVTSSIFTAIAVFLPLVFVRGVIGQVFRDLSWSVVYSHLASLVAAFTVVPMLSGAFSASGKKHGPPPRWVQKASSKAPAGMAYYDKLLTQAMKNPARVVKWAAGACVLSLVVLMFIPRSLFPEVEGNQIMLNLDMPVGTSLEETNRRALLIEDVLKKRRAVVHTSVTVGSLAQEGLQPLGSHQAKIILDLKGWFRAPAWRIMREVRQSLKSVNLGGGRVSMAQQGGTFSFLGQSGAPVVLEIKSHDFSNLEAAAQTLTQKLKNISGLVNVRNTLSEPAPEIQLHVKRDALANLSLSVTDLAETVLTALKGKVVSKFREAGKEIDIRLRLRPEDRANPEAIHNLLVHSPLDVDVPLGVVASIERGMGPSEITRFDQQRTVLVTADISGRSLQSVEEDIRREIGLMSKSSDMSITLTGESARLADSFRSLKIVLLLSIVFVYMIMAAQFENLAQPLLILFTIPLALIGMAPALLICGHDLTVMAAMGLILLAGIVVNNGIVLIDFVNQMRSQGMSLRDALWEGCHTRLRPILMTAVATILGMIPLSLGIGEGAQTQAPMAVVVISGLFVSTLLTLVVLPSLFLLYEQLDFQRFFNRLASHLSTMRPPIPTLPPQGGKEDI